MDGFERQNEIGKKGEQFVKHYLESRGNKVTDYSNIKEWQNKDIDFEVEKNGKITTLEVKNDLNLFITNNIFIESYSYYKSGRYIGFLEKCKAQYIAYVNTNLGKGIIVNWERLKAELIKQNISVRNRYDKIDKAYQDYYLFPLKLAKELGLVVHYIPNEKE